MFSLSHWQIYLPEVLICIYPLQLESFGCLPAKGKFLPAFSPHTAGPHCTSQCQTTQHVCRACISGIPSPRFSLLRPPCTWDANSLSSPLVKALAHASSSRLLEFLLMFPLLVFIANDVVPSQLFFSIRISFWHWTQVRKVLWIKDHVFFIWTLSLKLDMIYTKSNAHPPYVYTASTQ